MFMMLVSLPPLPGTDDAAGVWPNSWRRKKYDPVLNAFVSVMAIYPIGSLVVLNSGEVAKVIGSVKTTPSARKYGS